MCFNIVSHIEWGCGLRQNTGRHPLDCRRTICRLSNMHKIEEHDCGSTCTGIATEDYYIVTDTYRAPCERCREAGHVVHPGVRRDRAERSTPGGIQFHYLTTN